jgi:hypothetical protein
VNDEEPIPMLNAWDYELMSKLRYSRRRSPISPFSNISECASESVGEDSGEDSEDSEHLSKGAHTQKEASIEEGRVFSFTRKAKSLDSDPEHLSEGAHTPKEASIEEGRVFSFTRKAKSLCPAAPGGTSTRGSPKRRHQLLTPLGNDSEAQAPPHEPKYVVRMRQLVGLRGRRHAIVSQ